MKLDSTLENAGVFVNIPDGIYNARVYEVEDKDPTDPTKGRTSKGGAPMAILHWEIIDGEHATKKVKYDNIMLGGMTREGKPMPLGQYCSFLHYTGVPWTCLDCDTRHSDRHSFLIAVKEDKARKSNLKIGSFYCKACEAPLPRISVDTDDFLGARCAISIGSEKQEGTDKVFNKVRGYTDLV